MDFSIQLIRRTPLARDIFELEFTRPGGLDFLPGQHIRFHYNGRGMEYTPVTVNADTRIRICLNRVSETGFSVRLCECPLGSRFKVSGPHGHFLYHPSQRSDVFVGTGTGVAPFVAFARSGARGYILLQGARNPERLIYREPLFQNSRLYVPCLSRFSEGKGSGLPKPFCGRVTEYLDQALSDGSYRFYLCGRRQMILDAMDIIDRRFPDSLIFTERFS